MEQPLRSYLGLVFGVFRRNISHHRSLTSLTAIYDVEITRLKQQWRPTDGNAETSAGAGGEHLPFCAKSDRVLPCFPRCGIPLLHETAPHNVLHPLLHLLSSRRIRWLLRTLSQPSNKVRRSVGYGDRSMYYLVPAMLSCLRVPTVRRHWYGIDQFRLGQPLHAHVCQFGEWQQEPQACGPEEEQNLEPLLFKQQGFILVLRLQRIVLSFGLPPRLPTTTRSVVAMGRRSYHRPFVLWEASHQCCPDGEGGARPCGG